MAEKLATGYDKRDFATGPATYSDEAFTTKIIDGLALSAEQTPQRLLDFMSGPGKLAQSIKQRLPYLQITLLDLSEKQLRAATVPSDRVVANAIVSAERSLPFADSSFNFALARYAVKDLTFPQQQAALKEVSRVTEPNGVFVIVDMVAPTLNVRDWLNEQHSLKQQFSGRDILTEGSCNINTEAGWASLLAYAGFKPSSFSYHMSYVATSDWLKGRQVNEPQLIELNKFILNAPQDAKREFNIRQEGDEVKLDYPIIIIRGQKM